MKTKHSLIVILSVLMAFTACMQTEFDGMPLQQLTDAERWQTTHTIQQLIDEFSTGQSDYPARPDIGDLFRVDTIRRGGTPVVISGRVVSSDIEGNIYKNLTIQDNTGMGLKISIDVSSSSAVYPVGQLIHIKCNGFVIGKYGDMFQLGSLYYNNNSDDRKKGYEPGRIPYLLFKEKVQIDGVPDKNKIVIEEMTIAEIRASGREIHSKIVKIKDAYFTGRGADRGSPTSIPDNQKIFAPSTNGVGYPQAREIQDGTGNIFIATSEYARFANKPIPAPTYQGDIIAIVVVQR